VQTLIQTGSTSETYGGQTAYFAWYELLPAAPRHSRGSVPGGSDVGVDQPSGPSTWTLSIHDLSLNAGFMSQCVYSTPGQTADWIEDAPFNPSLNQVDPLADYGTVRFTNARDNAASAETLTPTFTANPTGQEIISYPGPVDATSSFNVTSGSPRLGEVLGVHGREATEPTRSRYHGRPGRSGPPHGCVRRRHVQLRHAGLREPRREDLVRPDRHDGILNGRNGYRLSLDGAFYAFGDAPFGGGL